MFLKLLKYKINAQRNLFIILSAIALSLSVVGALDLWFLQEHVDDIASDVISVFAGLFGGALLMVIWYSLIAYTIAVSILLAVQFYKRHFSDEGYLTFTLPVTTHQHLLSSYLNNLIWTVITLLVMLSCIMILISPLYSWSDISDDLRVSWMYWRSEMSGLGSITPFMSLMTFGSLLSGCLIPLLAITIGCVAVKRRKLLASFGIYYGINSAISVITGVLSLLAMIGDAYIMDSLNSDTLRLLLTTIVPLFLYIGITIGGYFLMYRLVDRKLNLP